MLRRGGDVVNDEAARKLDREFEDILAQLRPYLLNLGAHPAEARLARLWLDRLNRAGDQRNLRNDYLLELYKQLRPGDDAGLRPPFDKPPVRGRLIPISKVQRLATSTSWNDLTETTSQSPPCSQKRDSWPRPPRSKSLRRDSGRSNRIPAHRRGYFDVHSSSPHRSVPSSPTVHFCEHDSRADRSQLRTYKDRIETLSTIIDELGKENDKLKQKLAYYHHQGTAGSNEVPHLRARVKQLLTEITSLKKRLADVHELKAVLEKTHREIVEEYKNKMTEQFGKLKEKLQKAWSENGELNSKIAAFEEKMRELDREKEESASSNEKSWTQKLESMKSEYERALREKEAEIRMKDKIVQQRESELSQKLGEIDSMNQKMRELQQLVDEKSQEDNSFQSLILDQYSSIKDELSRVRGTVEVVTQQKADLKRDMKRNVEKIGTYTDRLRQEYEKKINLITKEKERAVNKLKRMTKWNDRGESPTFSEEMGAGPASSSVEMKYGALLRRFERAAEYERDKIYEKLSFLDDYLGKCGSG